jgi:hypothetical protein
MWLRQQSSARSRCSASTIAFVSRCGDGAIASGGLTNR